MVLPRVVTEHIVRRVTQISSRCTDALLLLLAKARDPAEDALGHVMRGFALRPPPNEAKETLVMGAVEPLEERALRGRARIVWRQRVGFGDPAKSRVIGNGFQMHARTPIHTRRAHRPRAKQAFGLPNAMGGSPAGRPIGKADCQIPARNMRCRL